jgi:hypothetical protein
MMQLKDYIFYRMYIAYRDNEGDDAPTFSVILFFSMIDICWSSSIAIFVSFFYTNLWYIIIVIIPLAGIIINFRRYNKNKVIEIFRKYKYSKCNKLIKNWMIYLAYWLTCMVGFLAIIPADYLFKYITKLIKGIG